VITPKRKSILSKVIPKILMVVTSGVRSQDFLGASWIPGLFKIVPKKYKTRLALNLIAISPHYFIYQESSMYDAMSHEDILAAEDERNRESRRKISDRLLQPYLNPEMTVLDFGCGVGYLAKAVSEHTQKVLAVDISCGAIACAGEINNADNIDYYVLDGNGLFRFSHASVNLVYSFAVVQHIKDEVFEKSLQEIYQILQPEGKCILHIVTHEETGETIRLHQQGAEKNNQNPWGVQSIKGKFSLETFARKATTVKQLMEKQGFTDIEIRNIKISDGETIEDDMEKDSLVVATKPQNDI
jgi:cyclopropane fatty-acyl-phospholipid synthase-like methyltransferase